MKKTILFFFIFSSFISFAQMNEINISYQAASFDDFQNHTSLTYYRSVGANKDLGLRANFQWFENGEFYRSKQAYAGSIDLVNRLDFINKKKLRIWGEVGISAKRHKKLQLGITPIQDCFCLPPIIQTLGEDGWIKVNQYGFSSGLGFDYNIFKSFNLGMIFTIKRYVSNKEVEFYTSNHLSNLSFLLGYKF